MTAIDSNVLIALWDRDATCSGSARRGLDQAHKNGGLVVSAPVYAELLAGPGRTLAFLDEFLATTGIAVDCGLGRDIWTAAGTAFQRYVSQRARAAPRRILADFVIGAHAHCRDYQLLTFDQRYYRAAFPDLDLLVPA